ncbi:MAG TPA: CoA transferase [Gemmatimonadales bacterium]|nr:CoA transferase [Gemmatimonadales bacterium]
MSLPLEGIRVVDMGVVLAGPQASLLLADLGAEVIRVESTQHFPPQTRGIFARPTKESVMASIPTAGGYPMREPGERPWNRFAWFNTTARNKLGMTVDLKQARGQDIFKRLVGISDVLITNQTPGTMEGLGLGFDCLSQLNPGLIYVEASSFGTTGPYRNYRALGLQMEAFAGHDLLRHYPDRDVSSNTWAVTADASGALGMALAAEMALYARRRTERGQYVDLSMVENFVGLIGHAVLDYSFNNRVPESIGNRDYIAIQGCYPCAGDDRWLTLTLPDDDAWARFCVVAGLQEACQGPEFASPESRRQRQDEIDPLIASWTSGLPREEAVARLRSAGLMAGPVLDDADAMTDPQLEARRYFVQIPHEDAGMHRYPGFPYRFHSAELTVRLPPVRLGEHNEYVYKQLLGVSEEEYAELEAEGHIGTEFAPHIR